jgi:hypothetical protein
MVGEVSEDRDASESDEEEEPDREQELRDGPPPKIAVIEPMTESNRFWPAETLHRRDSSSTPEASSISIRGLVVNSLAARARTNGAYWMVTTRSLRPFPLLFDLANHQLSHLDERVIQIRP